jgi:hypothetical protein
MVRSAGVSSVEPVVNPGVREARRQRLIRMTKEQIAGRTGPVRQVRYRDEVVSPLALELECRKLLLRAQRAAEAAEALALPEPRLPSRHTVHAGHAGPGPPTGTMEHGCGYMRLDGTSIRSARRRRGLDRARTGPGAGDVTCGSAGRLGNEISETSRSTFSTIS